METQEAAADFRVKAARAVKRRKISESEALFASAEAQRLRKPVLVTGVKVASVVTVIQPSDFSRIGIDNRYQRQRITTQVNGLVTVLMSGGQIPDPVDIAERPDGSWWLIDGQQRFLAHSETRKPLKAHIHMVDNIDSEIMLFFALNSRYKLTPRNVLRGWPGPTGDLIRRLNTSEKSPLKGMIDLGDNSKLPIDGASLAKAILMVLTGVWPSGDTATGMLPRTDAALRVPGASVWAEAYVHLLSAVFGPSTGRGGYRVRVLPMMALAEVAHEKYVQAGRPIFPSSTARLRQVNWNTVVPTHALKYLHIIEDRIKKLWR